MKFPDIINDALLSRCAEQWKNDSAGHRAASTLAHCSLHDAVLNHSLKGRLPFEFSIDLAPQGITDQGTSLRCWAFSFLNLARWNVVQALDLQQRDFELSQCYIYFYDQMEKCRQFLQRMIRCADRPLTDPAVSSALRDPISDYGYLSFLALAGKYGVVPKYVMPDTYCLPDTRPVTRILSMKLRWCARELRAMHAAGHSAGQLEQAMKDMLCDIYRILCRFLGEPPRSFTFEYRDTAGRFHRMDNLTPLEFFRRFCGIDPDDFVELSYMPGEQTPFGERYYRPEYPGAPMTEESRPTLNLCIDDIKAAVISQLRSGEQVTFGSDVAKFSSKTLGYMAADLFLYEDFFGTPLMMHTPDSRDYRWTAGTHIMCFDGVSLRADGTPERWKVQNSYGPDMGIEGHYVMDDSWFEPYVVSATVRRRHLPAHAQAWLEREPRPL